jgi:hypothetical protein
MEPAEPMLSLKHSWFFICLKAVARFPAPASLCSCGPMKNFSDDDHSRDVIGLGCIPSIILRRNDLEVLNERPI